MYRFFFDRTRTPVHHLLLLWIPDLDGDPIGIRSAGKPLDRDLIDASDPDRSRIVPVLQGIPGDGFPFRHLLRTEVEAEWNQGGTGFLVMQHEIVGSG